MLKVPVNNFSVMLGRSNRFLGITSTFFFFLGGGGGKYVLLKDTTRRPKWGSNPPTSGSGVRGVNHQTTAPPKADLLLLFGLLQGSMNTEKMKVQIIQLNALNGNQISMNAENTNFGVPPSYATFH